MYTGVYLFIGGVIFTGVGLGVWLQAKLDETHQDIRLPSAFAVGSLSPGESGQTV